MCVYMYVCVYVCVCGCMVIDIDIQTLTVIEPDCMGENDKEAYRRRYQIVLFK